jgi:hypothetical protein
MSLEMSVFVSSIWKLDRPQCLDKCQQKTGPERMRSSQPKESRRQKLSSSTKKQFGTKGFVLDETKGRGWMTVPNQIDTDS